MVSESCHGIYYYLKIDTLAGEIARRKIERVAFSENHIIRIIHNIASGLKYLQSLPSPIISRAISVF